MKLLLDTHTLLWFLADDPQLSAPHHRVGEMERGNDGVSFLNFTHPKKSGAKATALQTLRAGEWRLVLRTSVWSAVASAPLSERASSSIKP